MVMGLGHNLNDHSLSSLAMAVGSTNEVVKSRMVQLYDGIPIVGEKLRPCGVAFLVPCLPHLHNRILLVLEAYMHREYTCIIKSNLAGKRDSFL